MSLNNLGEHLYGWYELIGDRETLAKAIDEVSERLAMTPGEERDRADRLNHLGEHLHRWYRLTRDRKALAEAIEHAREAVMLTPVGHHHRPRQLSNLAAFLSDWYGLTADREALAEAIDWGRQTVEQIPHDHGHRAAVVCCLGSDLCEWYHLAGEPGALTESITCARQALALTPEAHRERPLRLHHLGNRLRDWYARTGERQALEEAIALARTALLVGLKRAGEISPTLLRGLYVALVTSLMDRDEDGDWEEAYRHLQAVQAPRHDAWGVHDREIVRCCLALANRREREGRLKEARRLWEQAWAVVQEEKGRCLAVTMGNVRQTLTTPDDARGNGLLFEIERRKEELAELEWGTARREIAKESLADQTQQHPRMKTLRDELQRLLAELHEVEPELASLTVAWPRTLPEIRAILSPGVRLLEFYSMADQLVLFGIDAEGLHVRTAPISQVALMEWTQKLLPLAEVVQSERWSTEQQTTAAILCQTLAALAERLAPALQELLGQPSPVPVAMTAPELILVPTGPLQRWPLHLLPWGEGILWDAWAISYVPTVDTLFYCAGRHPEAEAYPNQGASGALRSWVSGKLGWVPTVEQLWGMRDKQPAEHLELGFSHLRGLTRSLLKRFRSLTTTLWPVDDRASCYLRVRFRELMGAGGRSKAACLRQAALELREGGWQAAADWLYERVPAAGQERNTLLALVDDYRSALGEVTALHWAPTVLIGDSRMA